MKKTVRFLVASAAFLIASIGVTSCSIGTVTSNNMMGGMNYNEQDLQEKPFKAIDVQVLADVYYTQNNRDECKVRLDYSAIEDADFAQKLKENVKVVYRDGEVKIGCKEKINVPGSYNAEGKRLKIYITSTDIVKITQEGVGSFHAKDINTDKLTVDNEGVGSVYMTKILANRLEVVNEGVGSVRIDEVTGDNMNIDNEGVGSVNVKKVTMGNLTVDNEGVGSVTLDSFKGGSLKVVNEGVGKVSAHVDCKSVTASLEGVGGIKLSGSAQYYTRNRDGIGKISDRDLEVGK